MASAWPAIEASMRLRDGNVPMEAWGTEEESWGRPNLMLDVGVDDWGNPRDPRPMLIFKDTVFKKGV